jgi:ATP-binding cassette subfamily B protein
MAMGWTISIFQQGAAAMQRMDEVLSAQPIRTNQEPDPRQAQPEGKNNDKNDALIRVKDLSFSYVNPYAKQDESQKDKPAEETRRKILSHVSFTVKPGELVAIVGPVGSGKTTLLSLLAGLYDAPRGSVFLAGRDIADWPLDELHQSIALMPQQSFLFSTTLHHNLALARPDASRAETEQLAKNVYLASDIQRFPKQLDTLVGERGVLLSGGQRQRVSLGRTLMKDSEILLLDDPFSNVDAETEENILATLAECQALRQRTTLIATHRFALVQQADKVIMLDAGELVAIGTHEQLMAENPKYQQLVQLETWRRQFEEPVLPQTEEVRP